MDFYTDKSHLVDNADWKYVVHFVKPYFKAGSVSADELEKSYGTFFHHYQIVDDIVDAQFAILPLDLEYYVLREKERLMLDFIQKAKDAGKEVITQTNGDFGITPKVKDVIVLRQNGYQSKRLPKQYAFPSIFADPLQEYCKTDSVIVRDKGEKPVVGFDGLAHVSFMKNLYDVTRTALLNLKSHLGLSIYDTNVLYPTTLYRTRALRYIEQDQRLVANFNKRSKYKAGAKNKQEGRKLTQEFYDNMVESDYILCVRGLGNFSKRLYETLAMGRIPIFINTDCILPFDNIIDWKKYCVWVEESQMDKIGEIVYQFHNNLTKEQFRDVQLSCRRLWIEHLSGNGAMMSLMSLVQ